MKRPLVNFVAFQIGWFACVLGAANDKSWIGVTMAIFVIALHLIISSRMYKETIVLITVTIVGYAWDSYLVSLGAFAYQGTDIQSLAPAWIAAMWAMFATTLNSSLAWLQGRYLLSFILGFVLGPVAYLSANKLGAVDILLKPDALALQAIAWAILMPSMLMLCSVVYRKLPQIDRRRPS